MRPVDFWTTDVDKVPYQTGALTVMDASDLAHVAAHFKIDLASKHIVDVGCGTGRLAQLCGSYEGYDLTPAMVAYCNQHGIQAAGLGDFARLAESGASTADLVCCFSVFTHIPRPERQAYLAQFARVAPRVLVDICHGEERGDISIYYADPAWFEADLRAAGFPDFSWYDFERVPEDGVMHRYYHAVRRHHDNP